MDQIEFLELSDVMQIHIDQIANYGGAIDIRDPNLLESAIEQLASRPKMLRLVATHPKLAFGRYQHLAVERLEERFQSGRQSCPSSA